MRGGTVMIRRRTGPLAPWDSLNVTASRCEILETRPSRSFQFHCHASPAACGHHRTPTDGLCRLRTTSGVAPGGASAHPAGYLGTSERALLVLEGWDTAGKGGLVRRLGWALDPRSFKVHPDRRAGRARARSALPSALLATL